MLVCKNKQRNRALLLHPVHGFRLVGGWGYSLLLLQEHPTQKYFSIGWSLLIKRARTTTVPINNYFFQVWLIIQLPDRIFKFHFPHFSQVFVKHVSQESSVCEMFHKCQVFVKHVSQLPTCFTSVFLRILLIIPTATDWRNLWSGDIELLMMYWWRTYCDRRAY